MFWARIMSGQPEVAASPQAGSQPPFTEGRHPPSVRGFGESTAVPQFERRLGLDRFRPPGGLLDDPASPGTGRELPFPSTGPHGHRGRMREKLLDRGPDALADYELLEMLLFFAMPKGDTKPLAKALINRFGSFARALAAPQQELLATRGLGPHSVSAIKLVQASSLRLAKAEVMEAPVLNNWDRLVDYLTAALARERVE
jgi:DNA repair protein RadC